MSDRTGPLKKEEVKGDQIFGKRVPARGLEAAYDDDEPEYTLDLVTALNPDYEGIDKKCGSGKRVPARGLEAAYDDDEPEYTLDLVTALNPDYEGTDKKCSSEKRKCAIERESNEGA